MIYFKSRYKLINFVNFYVIGMIFRVYVYFALQVFDEMFE